MEGSGHAWAVWSVEGDGDLAWGVFDVASLVEQVTRLFTVDGVGGGASVTG